jgi:hypothetical protein
VADLCQETAHPRIHLLIDDLQLLAEDEALRSLLSHYETAGSADRAAWQDRLMHLEDTEPRELVTLHGQLIAFGWVDQNTGGIGCGYRITNAGLRALRDVRRLAETGEDDGEPTLEDAILPLPEQAA